MNNNREIVLQIIGSESFDKATFERMARQYFTDDTPEIIDNFLKRQFVCDDFSEIIKTHSMEEIIDFLNRLIASKDRDHNMSWREKKSLCVISDKELDEFTRLATKTNEIPADVLAETAPPLTGRSFFEMMRVVFDAAKVWDYPPDTSTAFLYSEARSISGRESFLLLEEPDSIEEFAGHFQALYHNEEIWFGGPGIAIHDESSRLEIGYTYAYKYTEWTGTIYSGSSGDIIKLYKAIKMYVALRKAGYPVFYDGVKRDRENYLRCLEQMRRDNTD